MEPEWRILEKGEIIQPGDEVDACRDGWRDDPRWVQATNIGEPACDPSFPSHRQYRRRVPFAWQVGRTYRTTRDGIHATVQGTSGLGNLIGQLANGVALTWDAKTGLVVGCEDMDGAMHLLPLPADEPSEPNVAAFKPQASSPYDRVIGGVEVDLWTLADIYGITSHRLFSAWKKITMAGRRGPKDKLRDLREARVAIDKEIAKLEAEGGAE